MAILGLTQNGNMKCKDADVSGRLTNKSDIEETIGPFTQDDIERIKQIIMDPSIVTTSDFEKYDITGDKQIDIVDWLYVARAVKAGGTLKLSGTFEINPLSSSKAISLTNSKTNRRVAILSLFGAYFETATVGGYIDIINEEDSAAEMSIYSTSIDGSFGDNGNRNHFYLGRTLNRRRYRRIYDIIINT